MLPANLDVGRPLPGMKCRSDSYATRQLTQRSKAVRIIVLEAGPWPYLEGTKSPGVPRSGIAGVVHSAGTTYDVIISGANQSGQSSVPTSLPHRGIKSAPESVGVEIPAVPGACGVGVIGYNAD